MSDIKNSRPEQQNRGSGNSVLSDTRKAPALAQVTVPPTLAAYYATPQPKLADWIKAVREHARQEFDPLDVEDALDRLNDRDPSLRKTFALCDSAGSVASIRRWVEIVAKKALKDRLPELTIDPMAPTAEQVARIAGGLAPGTHSNDKNARIAAEHTLRLGIRLVLDRREYEPADVLAALFRPLANPNKQDVRPTATELRQRLETANIGQLRDLALVQAYSIERIAQADWARRDAQDKAHTLKEELRKEALRIAEQASRLEAIEASRAALQAEVGRLQQTINDTRQIGAHGTADLLARNRSFLVGRLDPLCSDALEALEEPPALEIAKDLVAFVRRAIKEEVSWLDEFTG
jgi:hypothetical protein